MLGKTINNRGMPYRKTILATGEAYHVYNRGVEKRILFLNKFYYKHFIKLLDYYRFKNSTLSYSHFVRLSKEEKANLVRFTENTSEKLVEIHTFCLMPNHFHLLLKQLCERGIQTFMKKVAGSYGQFFNKKNERVGHLFQGNFRAARIENNEQLIHVSRYIHLNPVLSYLVKKEELRNYEYSSYPQYLKLSSGFCNTAEILQLFKNVPAYENFVLDHIDYARKIDLIKHLSLDHE